MLAITSYTFGYLLAPVVIAYAAGALYNRRESATSLKRWLLTGGVLIVLLMLMAHGASTQH